DLRLAVSLLVLAPPVAAISSGNRTGKRRPNPEAKSPYRDGAPLPVVILNEREESLSPGASAARQGAGMTPEGVTQNELVDWMTLVCGRKYPGVPFQPLVNHPSDSVEVGRPLQWEYGPDGW